MTTAGSPPAKMESVAVRAPRSPPETGASMAVQDFAAALAEISAARVGSDVVMSTKTPPGGRRERAASVTDLTSEGKPTMVKTTSEWAATSAGELAKWAPWSSKGWALEMVRLKTVRV